MTLNCGTKTSVYHKYKCQTQVKECWALKGPNKNRNETLMALLLIARKRRYHGICCYCTSSLTMAQLSVDLYGKFPDLVDTQASSPPKAGPSSLAILLICSTIK